MLVTDTVKISSPDLLRINYTVKRLSVFPSPAGMSLTKLSRDRTGILKLFPGYEEFG